MMPTRTTTTIEFGVRRWGSDTGVLVSSPDIFAILRALVDYRTNYSGTFELVHRISKTTVESSGWSVARSDEDATVDVSFPTE